MKVFVCWLEQSIYGQHQSVHRVKGVFPVSHFQFIDLADQKLA